MKAFREFVQLKEVENSGFQLGENNLRLGEIVSIDPEYIKSLKKGFIVLFDTFKSLKHGNFYYVKADTILAYDDHQ